MTDSCMARLKCRIAAGILQLSSLQVSGAASCLTTSLALVLLTSAVCSAQQAPQDSTPSPSTTLASEFFEHDFVNVFAFGRGIYDTSLPELTSRSGGEGASWGYDVGGGITLGHQLKDGSFSLSYRGDYVHYESTNYDNGTNQNLSLLFQKRLNRRWSIGANLNGGVTSYGSGFYASDSGEGATILTNPLSSQSRYASAGMNLTYQQTRRLSYTAAGQFFYSSYSYAGSISSKGGSGTASVNYRTTARTTIGGSYSHTYFAYSGSVGNTSIDSGYLTLTHLFPDHVTLSVSAGVSHADSKGTITEPVTLLLGQQLVTGFLTGPYHESTNAPSFQVSISRFVRHAMFSVTAGQGVNAGNGTFLTSKDQYANASYSMTRKLTNLSFGAGYTRLRSIANTVSNKYATGNISASYGFNLVRYVSANVRYDFIHYDGLYGLKAVNENRFTFGLNFSSKSIPLTLF
jgi:hypothetical protein